MSYVQFQITGGVLSTVDDTGTIKFLGNGYSGNGQCINDPVFTWLYNHGPIPVGKYLIGAPVDIPASVGHFAIPLEPLPENNMFGRTGFYCHGDNPQMNHTASDGCIVTGPQVRLVMAGYKELWVIA